eukprot:Gb_41101 [translate_table: standard]
MFRNQLLGLESATTSFNEVIWPSKLAKTHKNAPNEIALLL